MDQERSFSTEYEEIDLMDYIKVILKRKWLILVLFSGAAIIAGVFSWFTPKVYKIDTYLEIGKIGAGVIETPPEVIGEINADFYGTLVREKLGIPETEYPKMKTENPQNTNLVKIEIESSESQKAKNILEEINNLILENHQEKLKSQRELIETNIKTIEDKIRLVESDIEKTKNKMKPIDEDIKRIENKIVYVEEEKKNLEDREKSLEQLSPYQQINQQVSGSLFTLFDVREKLANKKQEIENLYLTINSLRKSKEDLEIQINSLKSTIEDLNTQINLLRASLEDIRPTKIIKSPTISEEPVKPRPALNIAIAGVSGIFLGTFLAFFKEWWEKNKSKI